MKIKANLTMADFADMFFKFSSQKYFYQILKMRIFFKRKILKYFR